MKKINWESVLDRIEDDMLLDALEETVLSGKRTARKIWVLAAVVALLCALGLTACTANLFGIRDMLMDLSGSSYVTLAGLQNSPEYQALREWEDRCPVSQYTMGPQQEDPIYHQYGAYSDRAKVILDEILEKYGLQPYRDWKSVYDGDPQSLYEALGCGAFLPESCAAFRGTRDPDMPGCSVRSGGTIYSYSDATLMPSVGQVYYELNNAANGYLPVFLGFRINPDTADQWNYKTKEGTRVLLCTDGTASVIIADLRGSFLVVSAVLLNGEGKTVPLEKSTLERFADLFQYGVLAACSESS